MANGEVIMKPSRHQSENIAPLFQSRRQVRSSTAGKTRYDWFYPGSLTRIALERESPRVIRARGLRVGNSRQGRLKFYISRWTEVARTRVGCNGAGNLLQRSEAVSIAIFSRNFCWWSKGAATISTTALSTGGRKEI